MFFQKKKKPVDIRDLPRNASMGKSFVPKDGCGFIDLSQKRKLPSEMAKEKALLKSTHQPKSTESTPSFGFFDTPTIASSSNNLNSDTDNLMRKISSQISDLDTKLYKMEQRIELLEKKADINSGSNISNDFTW